MLHRDVSFNNILIREWKDDSGHTMRQGILADWELSKYKEDIKKLQKVLMESTIARYRPTTRNVVEKRVADLFDQLVSVRVTLVRSTALFFALPLTYPPSQALIFNANRLEYRRDNDENAHYVPAEEDAWVTLTSVKPEHELDERAYTTMDEFRSKNPRGHEHFLRLLALHMEEVDKEISEMKLSLNARARVVAESYLSVVRINSALILIS